MKRIITIILSAMVCVSVGAQTSLLPVSKKALYDKKSRYYIDFENYPTTLRELPIGVFDSGTGGFTVLEAILKLDAFNNETGEEGADGIPDFKYENFEYLADQANMPYGRYDSEGKSDYLSELAVKDALFLMGNSFWENAESNVAKGKKSPVKIIVIACNTATAYGLEHIQTLLSSAQSKVKVIGVVNAGAGAAINSLVGKRKATVAVLATEGTIASGVYERTLKQMTPPTISMEVVNQPGIGFAESVDEERDFVDRSLTTFSENYRGPKLGTGENDINPALIDVYNFDTSNNNAFIERDKSGRVLRVQLNSSDNYARYNLVNLLEKARRQGISSPIDRIILGCTHYPFALETLKNQLTFLQQCKDKSGNKPYAKLISEDCKFIDPAENTAYMCYKTLLEDGNLNDIGDIGMVEPYISVASKLLPSECLDENGNLTYAFKYGREPGTEDVTTMMVPFSKSTVSADNLSRIKRLLPLCAAKIDEFLDTDKKIKETEQNVNNDKKPFTPWTLFVDAGIIAILLLIGKLIRAKVKFVQQLFIPPSLIAGFLGLALGPNGFNCIPLSGNTGTYASILIACIFSCLPFSSSKESSRGNNIGRMWVYSQVGQLAQWTLGGLLGICVFKLLWPQLNSAFGLAMPSGFCGGHGTAAAIGAAFQTYNYNDMLTLAMTAATVGIIFAIVFGLFIVKWGTKKGYTSFITDFGKLPQEYRSGLLPEDKQKPMGKTTISGISLDSLTFNFSVVMMIALGGYGFSKLVQAFVPQLELPVFSCAFVVGIIVATVFKKTGVRKYVCSDTISHLSGTFTDILVACGIASIKLSVVLQNIVPLLVLMVIGLVCTFIYVFFVARKMMPEYWFEKAMFSWGWFTGTMAMGIALLRIVDPEQRSHCLEDYGMAYLFMAPVEISLVTFAPIAFMTGYGWVFIGVCAAAICVVLAIGKAKGWLSIPKQKQ